MIYCTHGPTCPTVLDAEPLENPDIRQLIDLVNGPIAGTPGANLTSKRFGAVAPTLATTREGGEVETQPRGLGKPNLAMLCPISLWAARHL